MDPVSASIGAAGSIGSTLVQGAINGRMNRKQRKWASKENQLNRDFSAEQAELARQWQEDFISRGHALPVRGCRHESLSRFG